METTAEEKRGSLGDLGKRDLSTLWVGIDVGSTTVKIAAIEPQSRELIFWRYLRHNAAQAATVYKQFALFEGKFPESRIEIAACGSGAEPIIRELGGSYIQEVIATSIAIRELHPQTRTAIELGGQDAKILAFGPDSITGETRLMDMRMNGSCAGGTGAFIDQMAVLLDIAAEDFNELAAKGRKVHSISGRCGVFAKSDILPLVNSGVPREDIALSVFHAVATQTICSLAQGMDLHTPLAFMGGPFSFNSILIEAFLDKLKCPGENAFKPDNSQVIAAIGAAMSIGVLGRPVRRTISAPQASPHSKSAAGAEATPPAKPFFASSAERTSFFSRHAPPPFSPAVFSPGTTVEAFLGIDAGSTTFKAVLIDTSGTVINKWYSNNAGDTIETARAGLLSLYRGYAEAGVRLAVRGVGTTGYGEQLCAQAFGADFHTVETVAHASAALAHFPGATFLLDIGGQDMKAMKIDKGVIQEVYLNEACSSGCGSFIEATAKNLGIPVSEVADAAFRSDNPASLGSRCTVFMLSSVTSEQKNGKLKEDIVAGLCRSVIENVFSKVIRITDASYLGDTIVVQGGTFKNDAILRAFEQYSGKPVFRAPHCGEMGAYGIALLTRQAMKAHGDTWRPTRFIGFDALSTIGYSKVTHDICTNCSNRCSRDIIRFSTGVTFCSGHRCERGNCTSKSKKELSASSVPVMPSDISLPAFREQQLLNAGSETPRVLPENGTTIGIPLVFEFWNSLPFWRALYTALGFSVEVSGKSSLAMAQLGNRFACSDSICFPAKLIHGHIEALLAKKGLRLFLPAMKTTGNRIGRAGAVHMCAIVQGLPILAKELNRLQERCADRVDEPTFTFETPQMRDNQVLCFFRTVHALPDDAVRQAIRIADEAQERFNDLMRERAAVHLRAIEQSDGFGVMLLSRPYHADSLINHKIPEMFASMGVPVVTPDAIPGLSGIDLSLIRPDTYNPFHSELYSAALFAARHPRLEAIQLVSFGCGHDAILSDEIGRIMALAGNKRPLVLKIDDGECRSALTIRIRSFIETVRKKRSAS